MHIHLCATLTPITSLTFFSMIQAATFKVPEQDKQANEFLRTHKPAGDIHFNKDTIVFIL
jgi:hypothetical protein